MARVKPMLKGTGVYVDLEDLGMDPFHNSLVRMTELVQRHLPEK